MINPIQINIPEEFMSERLLIRTPRPGDGAEFNAAIRESFSELSRWLDWADHVPEVEETERNAVAAYERYKAKTDFRFLLFLRGTMTIVGACGLHSVDWTVPKFEIGYWVRSSHAGQGYITEAVNATAGFAFKVMGAKRVWMRIDSRNTRSRAVAERTGFEYEGMLRSEARMNDGVLRDTVIYSRIANYEL